MKKSSDETSKGLTEHSLIEEQKCPLCNGTGWVFVDYNTVKECECGLIEKRRNRNMLRFANIPEAYKDVCLKDFTTRYYSDSEVENVKGVAQIVKYWLDSVDEMTEQGKGLYFWSQTKGSGKTMLATAIANELVRTKSEFVRFATSIDILDEIRATYNDSGESESKMLDELATVKYLVIDDFGTERKSDWAGERFYQIVNRRYINKKVTIYTSNYDLMTIKYDDRITNRIRERSFIVHFPEESVREFKARQENDFKNFKERKQNWEELEKGAFTGE